MKTTLLFLGLFLCVSTVLAGERRTERAFDWGTVWILAGSTENIRRDDIPLILFQGDVRADLRFADGSRVLLAAGRLELDPRTGDFLVTGWPFFVGRNTKGDPDLRLHGVREGCFIQRRGETVKITTCALSYIDGDEPAPMRNRRQRLAEMEARP